MRNLYVSLYVLTMVALSASGASPVTERIVDEPGGCAEHFCAPGQQ